MASINACTIGLGKGFKSYGDLYHCWRQQLVMKKVQMFQKHGFLVQTFLLQQQA